jgi:hypothetical protein
VKNCGKHQAREKLSIVQALRAKGERSYIDTKMTSKKLTQRLLPVAVAGNMSFRQTMNPEILSLLEDAYPDLDRYPERRSLAKEL